MIEQNEKVYGLLQEIIKNKNHKIYVYGAGGWAKKIKALLDVMQVKISGFCVSDGKERDTSFATDKKVYMLSEIPVSEEIFFIVAVSPRFQKEIHDNLLAKRLKKIYIISQEQFEELNRIEDISKKEFCNEIVYNQYEIIDSDNENYEQKYIDLQKKYKGILFRKSFGLHIGGLLEELFCHFKFQTMNPEYYYVYHVENREPAKKNFYMEPNQVAIQKYQGENFVAINEENLNFWKYVIKTHYKDIRVDSEYSFINSSNSIIEMTIRKLHENVYKNNGANYIHFSDSEKREGELILKKMGRINKFGCVFTRDAAYYKKNWTNKDELIDIMEYYRNSHFSNMRKAIEFFTDNKYSCIRVGKISGEVAQDENVIDYVTNYHTDFMDMYLGVESDFYLGDHSGVIFFQIFKDKPLAITNYPIITAFVEGIFPFVRERDLIIYHKFYDPQKGRVLNLSEILEIEDCSEEEFKYSGSVNVMEKYHRRGIVPIENTEEEIYELAKELYGRLNGTISYTEEDRELRKKYWDILMPYVEQRPGVFWIEAEVGIEFLKKNEWLTK